MLVLIAGITGHIGQTLIPFLTRNHTVRGLSRTPTKLPPETKSQLESFILSSAYHDIAALDRACAGVDAVVCAYNGMPELLLEGQLLLFRAAERAHVKHFISANFAYDWRALSLTQLDAYDPMIAFHNHIEMSCSPGPDPLKPTHVLVGVLAEVLFGVSGRVDFTAKAHGPWDPENLTMQIWGDENRVWNYTSEKDVAEFVAGILSLPDDVIRSKRFWSVSSGTGTLGDIAAEYGAVRGKEVGIKYMGSVEELRVRAFEARERGMRSRFWEYVGWFYTLWTVEGVWGLGELDNGRIGVEGEGLGGFLGRYAEV